MKSGNKEIGEAAKARDVAALEVLWSKYYKEGAVMIRPSGNPLTKTGFIGMMSSEDITYISDEVLKVEDVTVFAGGQAAAFTYTTHSKFEYKGTPNDDIAKFSATVEKDGDSWKIVHVHRGTGQKPEAA